MKILSNPSLLTRLVSLYIILLTSTGAMIVILVDYFRGVTPPDLLISVVLGLLPAATYALGLQQGVPLTNGDTTQAMKTLAAKINAGDDPHA